MRRGTFAASSPASPVSSTPRRSRRARPRPPAPAAGELPEDVRGLRTGSTRVRGRAWA